MTMLAKTNQSGRSMVEMLGVLAIIGVLSVGGISGYSKAMAKFKLTKAQDQITMLLMNIRTAYATSPSYAGLDKTAAISYNIAPSDMIVGTGEAADKTLFNAFGGGMDVASCSGANQCTTINADAKTDQYFYIQMAGLGREACMSLASSDWGSDGLVGVSIQKDATTDEDGNATAGASVKKEAYELPFTLKEAGDNCDDEGYSAITWVYY